MASQVESFLGKPSSFFTFCLDDFATKQSIPKAFEEKYPNVLLQENVKLKTNGYDRCWEVKIKQIDGDFFIVDGWSDFVKDINLVEMFFLVFRIVSSSTLHVDVFGHDSCLHLPPKPAPTPTPTPVDEGETSLRFVKELKEYQFTSQRLEIPKDFATGIATTDLIELEDEHRRKWPISVTNRNNSGMYSMTGGFLPFLKGNNMQVGDILLFEFLPDSDMVVKVSVVEEEAGRQLLTQAKYGGFLGERTRKTRTRRTRTRRTRRTSSRFVKELKDYHYSSGYRGGNLHIPKDFAESTGIATSKHMVIDLEDESGRKWPVSLTDCKNSRKYHICGGWAAFLKANNLQIGTILLFEFVPDSDYVVKVSAMEQGDGRALLAQAGPGGLL